MSTVAAYDFLHNDEGVENLKKTRHIVQRSVYPSVYVLSSSLISYIIYYSVPSSALWEFSLMIIPCKSYPLGKQRWFKALLAYLAAEESYR